MFITPLRFNRMFNSCSLVFIFKTILVYIMVCKHNDPSVLISGFLYRLDYDNKTRLGYRDSLAMFRARKWVFFTTQGTVFCVVCFSQINEVREKIVGSTEMPPYVTLCSSVSGSGAELEQVTLAHQMSCRNSFIEVIAAYLICNVSGSRRNPFIRQTCLALCAR